MPTFPHLPENLKRLRSASGQTQAELARLCGLSLPGYRALEKGNAEPRSATLHAIANALAIGLADLFRPARQLRAVRFRSLKRLKRRDQVLVDVARQLDDWSELEGLLAEQRPGVLSAEQLADRVAERGPRDAVAAARRVRAGFRLDPDEPVHDICGLLEARGIRVLSVKLESEAFFGLSIAEPDGGPAVVVNVWKRLPVEAWIFSAAHELGHLVLHPSAYDVGIQDEDDEEEREANAFASEFLMPEPSFRRQWDRAAGLPLLDRVLKVKRVFRVSWRTVVHRVAEPLSRERQALVWRRMAQEYAARFKHALLKHHEPQGLPESALSSPALQFARGPEPAQLDDHDFVQDRRWLLVRRALEAEKISLARGAEMLAVPLVEMRRIAASWTG